MKHFPQSLGVLGIEGRVDGVWPGGSPSQRCLQIALIELVDSVAGGLWVAAQRAGDLVGILAPGACEQDLATAEDEGNWRTQACLQEGPALGVRERTYKDWSSHAVEDG